MIRRIGVLTGDNDAPGMNAVLRAMTRTALDRGWGVMGICDGYAGLMAGDFITLTARSVDGISQWSGTLLDSIDSRQISSEAGHKHALSRLAEHNIDALVVIGGGESQGVAYALSQKGFPVIGVAASVENDLAGFDMSLGVVTALNIALETVDQARITRTSDCNAFFVEVAGRKCGYLAVASGIASGAAAIVIPELDTTPDDVETAIKMAHERGDSHPTIVVAEGAAYPLDRLTHYFAQHDPQRRKPGQARLGHIQRRSAPSGFDRLLGARLGAHTVDALMRAEYGVLVGLLHREIGTVPLAEVVGKTREIDQDMTQLAEALTLKLPVSTLAAAKA